MLELDQGRAMLILQLLVVLFFWTGRKLEEDEGGDGVVVGIIQEHQRSNLL